MAPDNFHENSQALLTSPKNNCPRPFAQLECDRRAKISVRPNFAKPNIRPKVPKFPEMLPNF